MVGHLCTDINQGALPALLPFLVLQKDISYASAAGLIFAANCVSSVIQPLFGYLGDKGSRPWLMGLGAFLAGAGLAVVGFLESYWSIFIAVAVSGTGVALFHPEGGRLANLAAGEKKGSGIALFSVGGNLGFAVGPIIASVAVTFWGLKGTAVFLLPAVAMLIVTLSTHKGLALLSVQAQSKRASGNYAADEDDWNAFFKVSACATARSVVAYGMTTFIPLYFTAVMMLSASSASIILAWYSAMAAIATLFGGQVSDRFGFHQVIRGGFLLLAPLLLLFPLIGNVWIATFLLLPIAMGINAPLAPSIALAQKFLPNHIGTSSGIILGLAISIGGMVTPGIGWIGDHYGLPAAMYIVAGFAVLTLYLSFLIPVWREKRAEHSQ